MQPTEISEANEMDQNPTQQPAEVGEKNEVQLTPMEQLTETVSEQAKQIEELYKAVASLAAGHIEHQSHGGFVPNAKIAELADRLDKRS